MKVVDVLKQTGGMDPTRTRTHLSGWHVLEGHVSIGQLAGCDAQAVDVGAEVVALQVLRGTTLLARDWSQKGAAAGQVASACTCCSTSGLSQGRTFTL